MTKLIETRALCDHFQMIVFAVMICSCTIMVVVKFDYCPVLLDIKYQFYGFGAAYIKASNFERNINVLR